MAVSRTSTRSALAGLAAALALGLVAPAAPSAPSTRVCDGVRLTFKSGTKIRATGIRATATTCLRARVVVRSCLRDRLRGWRVSTAPTPDDRDPNGLVGLDRRGAHISFQIRGRGGCV